MKPLAIDLYAGLGGWTEGLLAEGYEVVGFDIERHQYGEHRYPAQLVLQDVRTLHGAQFKTAALIVASPPCQAYSYRAMPWKRAKALPPPDNSLFDACFRIQREACEAAGRHIPLVVENVRGAQKWVGRSRWNFGTFHLWGDVPALMPMTRRWAKVPGLNWSGSDKPGYQARAFNTTAEQRLRDDIKNTGEHAGLKIGGDWFSDPNSTCRLHSSRSQARKRASAMIAKIPLVLARYIAASWYPRGENCPLWPVRAEPAGGPFANPPRDPATVTREWLTKPVGEAVSPTRASGSRYANGVGWGARMNAAAALESYGVSQVIRSTCGTCGEDDVMVAVIPIGFGSTELKFCADCLVDLANLVFDSPEPA